MISLTSLISIIPNSVISYSSGEMAAGRTVGAISSVFVRGSIEAGIPGLINHKVAYLPYSLFLLLISYFGKI